MYASMEDRLIHQYWRDGLLDTLAGVAVLAIGTAWHFDLVAVGAVAPAVLAGLWKPLHQRWIEPLSGFVQFTGKRRQKTRRFLTGTVMAGVGVLILAVTAFGLARAALTGPVLWVAGLPAALLAPLSLAAALLTRQRRFLAYAAVLLVSGGWVAITHGEPEAALLLSGWVLTLVGIALLIRFRADARDGGMTG